MGEEELCGLICVRVGKGGALGHCFSSLSVSVSCVGEVQGGLRDGESKRVGRKKDGTDEGEEAETDRASKEREERKVRAEVRESMFVVAELVVVLVVDVGEGGFGPLDILPPLAGEEGVALLLLGDG